MAIQIRRGNFADLPESAPDGQLLFCEDTKQLFIGTGTSVVQVAGGGGGGPTPNTSYHIVAKHSDNHHLIKSGGGVLTGVNASGSGQSSTPFPVYAKFFDSLAEPDLTSAIPICVVAIQEGVQSPDPVPAGGIVFDDGLWLFIVNGIQDNDDTVVATNDAVVDAFYQ